MSSIKALSIQHLTKRFGGKHVFEDFGFGGKQGDVIALIGPNGCGKSTLLNILAGVTAADLGLGGGLYRYGSSFERKDISYVFQNYRDSLLPRRTGYENLALPLEISGYAPGDVAQRVSEIQSLFSSNLDLGQYPYTMSGGQQQMLAFMRALVMLPTCLLLDEPFAALDYQNTLMMREGLQRYYLKKTPLIIIVTHDIEEAVHLASIIMVLGDQPTRVYDCVENHAAYPRDVQFLMSGHFTTTKNKALVACEYAFIRKRMQDVA